MHAPSPRCSYTDSRPAMQVSWIFEVPKVQAAGKHRVHLERSYTAGKINISSNNSPVPGWCAAVQGRFGKLCIENIKISQGLLSFSLLFSFSLSISLFSFLFYSWYCTFARQLFVLLMFVLVYYTDRIVFHIVIIEQNSILFYSILFSLRKRCIVLKIMTNFEKKFSNFQILNIYLLTF